MNQVVAKQKIKQLTRHTIGEVHVGKRFKLRRLNQILPNLNLNPSRILDAGSGDAAFVYWLADHFPSAQVTACDLDAVAIEASTVAQPPSYKERVHFRVGSFSSLRRDSFDLITALDVLEHIDDDRAAVADLTSALSEGGSLLVHVPRDRWVTRSGVEYRVPDSEAWRINAGHVRQGYSPDALRRLLSTSGLDVEVLETWLDSWGVLAFDVYTRFEHPALLRLFTVPVTDVCAFLEGRRHSETGNAVFAHAIKRAALGGRDVGTRHQTD